MCWGLVFTAGFSRFRFVRPTFRQSTEEMIKGFEAAPWFFGGIFPAVEVERRDDLLPASIVSCGYHSA